MIYWMAISLGLVSSLHCLGMCGPLVLVFAGQAQGTSWEAGKRALTYNLGRITTYVSLGLLFGLIGQGLLINDAQQYISLIVGSLMILGFFLGFNLDQRLNHLPQVAHISIFIRQHFQRLLNRRQSHFYFGLLNGLLPCGMVYLALAGAISVGSIGDGAAFMLSFGLGTLPAMTTPFLVGRGVRTYLRPYLPTIQRTALLLMGVFLILRGIEVEFPTSLNFLEMLRDPVMCYQ